VRPATQLEGGDHLPVEEAGEDIRGVGLASDAVLLPTGTVFV
jgi:hypothetical protein